MDTVFFDAFTCIGPRIDKPEPLPWTLEHLLDEMRHCSVAGALVAHWQSVVYDPMFFNRRLCGMLRPHGNLYPLWNVMPHYSNQVPDPEELLVVLEEHDVRAVMLNPKANGWDLLSRTSAPLLEALQRQRPLTVVTRDQFDRWHDFEEFLLRYPDLPVLLSHVSWGEQRFVLSLMALCPNLHLTFNHFQVHYGPERLVELGYEDRLLFSSAAPAMSMGAHRTYLDYADLPDSTVAKIAGGNLKRLLKGQGPAEAARNPHEDDLMRRARRGEPQEALVLDPHIHMLHPGLCGAGRDVMHKGDPEGVLALLKRLGYDGGGVMSWSVVTGDSLEGNAAVKQALEVFPEGYWGVGSFDPMHQSQEELARLIPELYADKRFKELKPFFFALRYDDPRYDVWWRYADKHRLLVLIDRNRSGADFSEVDALAERYPNAAWIVPHCGANYAYAQAGIECGSRRPNVYLDITYTTVTAGVIEYMVEGLGADRVLYGSDLPMRDPRQQLGWVVYSRLSVADKEKVLGLNARRLLERCR